ncbi:unnamed protein product [Blepharisma stoltei]|uniref:GATA-type domain-containing protein n=1 Tax=Blepharisma stoltei TaxID=1481888 RepID=A0AAU9K0C3_9CILI|nr:unnamed protein product [Blepharisma stoltei]
MNPQNQQRTSLAELQRRSHMLSQQFDELPEKDLDAPTFHSIPTPDTQNSLAPSETMANLVAPQNIPQREMRISQGTLPRPLNRYDTFDGVFNVQSQPPPSVLAQVIYKEISVSSPRFLRFTSSYCALDETKQNSSGIPLGFIWQPLADLDPREDPIPFIDGIPYRCSNCGSYVNPFFKYDTAQKWICNICESRLEISEKYIGNPETKPELTLGTYEFAAPSDFSNRPLVSPLYLFCVEISAHSLEMGLLQQVVSSIKNMLDYIPFKERCQIGVVTFGCFMQLFRLNSRGDLTEVVISDIDDPFIPDPPNSYMFHVGNQFDELENFLEKLASWDFSNPPKVTISIGAVLGAIKDYFLKNIGGRVIVFTTQLGTIGKLKLSDRVDVKLFGTDKENNLYLPLESYSSLGKELCEDDICVDIFACTNEKSIDVPSLACLCTQTGGDLYYYSGYRSDIDGEKIYYQIFRILTRSQGYQGLLRVRCSNGLTVDYYTGKFKRKGPVEMEIAAIDSDKSIGVVLKYDSKLKDDYDNYVQCAMLYTNILGQRMIRIFNGVIKSTKYVANFYRSSDPDVIINISTKICAYQLYEQNIKTVRENWLSSIGRLCNLYFKEGADQNFKTTTLPEPIKILPLYINSAMKTPAFSVSYGIDARISFAHYLLAATVQQSRLMLYPMIYSLHDINEQSHFPGNLSNNETVILPNLVPCSKHSIQSNGVYFMADGEIICLYIGSDVSVEFIVDVFGAQSFEELSENPEKWVLADLGNDNSSKIIAIYEEIRNRNPGHFPTLYWHFEGKSSELVLKRFLVEDQMPNEISYHDYYLKIHKMVITKQFN